MSSSAILVIGLGLVLALPLAWRAFARRFDPFEPVVLFALAYGVMFVVRPAAMLLKDQLSYGGVDLRGTFTEVTVLALAGGVAFLCGYELRVGHALAGRLPSPRRIATHRAITWSIALTAIAGLALLVLVARSSPSILVGGRTAEATELSAASSYVWYAPKLVIPAALCLIALALRQRSRRLGLAAAAATAACLLVTIPLGSRIFLLPFLGGIFVFVYAHRRTRPPLLLLVGLAIAALFASYALGVVRNPERRPEARAEFAMLLQHPSKILEPILEGNDAEMAPVLAGALTVVPERLHYRYGGAVFGDLVLRPVPRALWHGKPIPGKRRIVAAVWPGVAGAFNPTFSPLLSFYWDFGVPGVLAGMGLFGIVARVLYEWFLRHRDSFGAQLIFSAALWYVVIGVRDDHVDTIVLASFIVLPLILIERFSASSRTHARPLLARARPSQR